MPASAPHSARQQQRVRAPVHAERGRHRRILGQRAQRAPEVRVAHRRPDAEPEQQRQHQRDELRHRHEQLADAQLLPGVDGLELAEVGGPEVLDGRLDDRRQAERSEQRVERRHREPRQQPLHRHAQCEEQRDDQRERGQRIHAADAGQLIAHVRGEECQPEVREVDDVQQPPRQAEAHPQQPVHAADEDAGQRRLGEQRPARKRHCTSSVAPGAAYSFG